MKALLINVLLFGGVGTALFGLLLVAVNWRSGIPVRLLKWGTALGISGGLLRLLLPG
jgi:hypothetical protein